MAAFVLLVATFALLFGPGVRCQTEVNEFPEGFLLGAGSSAYQIEGAWDEDGKGENIWDHMLHEHPEYGTDGENGDVACDSYHKYAEDVQMLVDLGASLYRFSISWSRILPTGDTDVINQAGIDYYNNLIDLLVENNITPVVTMIHFDTPQPLEELGGWPNEVLADYFVEYARILFENFGDRVKYWVTFNEPSMLVRGYADYTIAPRRNASGIADYLASHTLIKAHARAYRLYDEQFRATQNGNIGMTVLFQGFLPYTDSDADIAAANRSYQFYPGLWMHPIYSSEGDYPAVVRERVDANSAAEGRARSRLPTFTEEEVEYIRGTADFIGLNHYVTDYATDGETGDSPSMIRDMGVAYQPGGPFIGPEGFRSALNWAATEYPGYPIIVTENGSSDTEYPDDTERVEYYYEYLAALLQAVNLDGVPAIGYAAWSLMDSVEWENGYGASGFYHVDFDDTNRTRTPKQSMTAINEVFTTRTVPSEYFS